jgi:hypothetical protein
MLIPSTKTPPRITPSPPKPAPSTVSTPSGPLASFTQEPYAQLRALVILLAALHKLTRTINLARLKEIIKSPRAHVRLHTFPSRQGQPLDIATTRRRCCLRLLLVPLFVLYIASAWAIRLALESQKVGGMSTIRLSMPKTCPTTSRITQHRHVVQRSSSQNAT